MVVSLYLESVCQTTTIRTSIKKFTLAACLSFASMVFLKPFMLKLKSGSNRKMKLWAITFGQDVIYYRPHLDT